MILTLTNNEIYNYANALVQEFDEDQVKLPIKVNFYLQKNTKTLIDLALEIENQRIAIAEEYGVLNSDTMHYDIPQENISLVSTKLKDLFNLTQDVNIYKVKLDDFGDIDLTSNQMQALLFMIDEEE